MGLANGVHHLAIATADIKGQIEFFTDAVGAELVGFYWMHGVEQTAHAFLRLSDESLIAFVQGPPMQAIAPALGVSHAGFIAGPVAPGAVQHIALNVPTHDDVLAMRDRLRSRGYWVLGPIDHGMCKSIYLNAPEGIQLEFASSDGVAVDADAWIDPDVAAAFGIAADELDRYRRPAAFEATGGKVAQPSPDQRPGFVFPAEMQGMAQALSTMTDEEISAAFDHATTPAQDRAAANRLAAVA